MIPVALESYSIKAIINQNRKHVSPNYAATLPRQAILSSVPISNVSINVAAPASPYKHLLEPQRNILVNISHSFCTCNGDHVGLLIKTGSIQKERMMTQTAIRNF